MQLSQAMFPEGSVIFPNPKGTARGFACRVGDAWLVAPCAGPDAAHCAHLADFTRGVEEDTQDAFWQLVGETALARVGDRPVWLSTCGTGVYWLHARLDSYPKYYSYDAYRRAEP
mgnify:CR=1 FL=1